LREKKEEDQEEGLDIESEGQRFLRHPLEFTHISSGFSEARLHPILGYARPHTGVDFAAPRGTAVHAVASGIVTFVGRQSGYGNIVRIDHPGPYDTSYAHLQGIAEGMEEGIAVEQGQVIGYVGSTGLATGPHLHFELLKDGAFVNPLTEKSLLGEPIKIVKKQPKPAVDPIIAEKKKRLTDQLAALEIKGKGIISITIPLQSTLVANGVAAEHKSERHDTISWHASSASD
jgi:murein DD-endopeptidase MepM/ murein hydrolase activator NlpD